MDRVLAIAGLRLKLLARQSRGGSAARAAMLKLGDSFLEVFEFTSPPPKRPNGLRPVNDHGITHICIQVKDIHAEYERLLAAGMQTVTSCSDLLKTGGYRRLLQYLECLDEAIDNAGAKTLAEFRDAAGWSIRDYARHVVRDPMYAKSTFDTAHTKTPRRLDYFDCIKPPCVDECPISQKVPKYMRAVRHAPSESAAERAMMTSAPSKSPALIGAITGASAVPALYSHSVTDCR